MKIIRKFFCASLLLFGISNADIVRLDNVGPSLGANLDGLDAPTTVSVPEISGLQFSLVAILGIDTGGALNSTSTSLGINSDNDSDTDAFESAFVQGFTFQFNQPVQIAQLDFTTFSSGESVSFAGILIENDDLSNGTLDTYDFGTPLSVPANTSITLSATAGTVGIEAIDLTVVPEPSVLGFLGLSLVMLRVFRARNAQ